MHPDSKQQKVICVIPARYHSTRLPGKPLAEIHGRPMIEWVYKRVSDAGLVDLVLVATDDERIAECVAAFGGEAVMTDPALPSGSDRVAAAVKDVQYRVIVNVQGDEPFIESDEIDCLARMMLDCPEVKMGTLVRRAEMRDGFDDPGSAKVVVDKDNNALYFSRSPIPFWRPDSKNDEPATYLQHVGVYAFTREFLHQYVAWGPSPLELIEKLEQLRVLEHGIRIKVVETPYMHFSVDTAEDLEKARELAINFTSNHERRDFETR